MYITVVPQYALTGIKLYENCQLIITGSFLFNLMALLLKNQILRGQDLVRIAFGIVLLDYHPFYLKALHYDFLKGLVS